MTTSKKGLTQKIFFSIILNVIISLLYFKQLIIAGNEVMFLDSKAMLLTPFVLLYSFFGFIICISFENKYFFSFNEFRVFELIPLVMFMIFILIFILFPFLFLEYEDGYKFALPFFLNLFEPIKIKYIFRQENQILFQKNLILFIISFALLFLTSLLPKHRTIENSMAFYMGGFYFMILAMLDYYFYKINKKM